MTHLLAVHQSEIYLKMSFHRYAVGEHMSTLEKKPKTIFLNGVEVDAVELTGNGTTDLAAAKRFLAEKGIDRPQERLTPRAKAARKWHRRFR